MTNNIDIAMLLEVCCGIAIVVGIPVVWIGWRVIKALANGVGAISGRRF